MLLLADFIALLRGLGPWGIFLLTLIDSAGIPITVGLDAVLVYLAIQNPGSAFWLATAAVIGSTAGNMVLYYLSRKGGEKYFERQNKRGSPRFRNWFDTYGLLTVFVPAMVPIPMPLKLFVVLAGVLKSRFHYFLATIVLARVMRYGGEVWLGANLGTDAELFLKQYAWYLVAFAAGLFIALYALATWMASRRAPEGVEPSGA